MSALSAHLRAGGRRPFAWGSCDCCLWACDWVLARAGVDPAAELRGRYRTAVGAARHLTRGGGFVATVAAAMARVGLVPTEAPVEGDIGIVVIGGAEALAVRTSGGWAAKSPSGVVVAHLDAVLAWRVPCLR